MQWWHPEYICTRTHTPSKTDLFNSPPVLRASLFFCVAPLFLHLHQTTRARCLFRTASLIQLLSCLIQEFYAPCLLQMMNFASGVVCFSVGLIYVQKVNLQLGRTPLPALKQFLHSSHGPNPRKCVFLASLVSFQLKVFSACPPPPHPKTCIPTILVLQSHTKAHSPVQYGRSRGTCLWKDELVKSWLQYTKPIRWSILPSIRHFDCFSF